ncbi:MAG: Verru_Chthon cassette protein A, partial [Verrucomicrobiales bacterium]|nr:Verru_Chthon cassette protein A [Verrucomicrobiales bacterium]
MSLTTILVLTFFTLASSEHRASKTYSQGLHAQQVAEQAVNMVVAQIREATSVGVEKAWASQPGAIRTWDQDGNFDAIYKLYSDDEMKSTKEGQVSEDYNDLNNWSSRPAHFVDLNEPVIRGEKVYYPVVDPTAANIPERWEGGLEDSDPEFGDNGVEGFKYHHDVVEEGDFGKKAATAYSASDGHVPMPVRWIYQLADGTLGNLKDSASGGDSPAFEFQAFSGNGVPSEKNQIVSRFAFWADDETTKLNVNTHAGGAAWDLPRAGGIIDRTLAGNQPAKNEWQRYPGHPATTHLSPALSPGYVINLGSLREGDDGMSDRERARDALEMLYKVTPRVVGGGSQSGTRAVDPRNREEGDGLFADSDPLYPSIDDLVMRADRRPHQYPDGTGNAISEGELGGYIERAKFFVTAYSRAPEVNMFNLPKVAMWPIYDAERSDAEYQTHLTPFDRLIHYCASVGGPSKDDRYDYIFKRRHADHPTYDYDRIPRNKELYEYLEKAMTTQVPGYGARFSDKYSDDYQQILTQIFDYIRSTNAHDDTVYGDRDRQGERRNNDAEHRTYTNWRNPGGRQGLKGHGQIVPIEIGDTKGFGRFYTLSSVQILAICAGQPFGPDVSGNPPLGRFPGYVGANDADNFENDVQDFPTGKVFLNLPPMPNQVKREDESTWPDWLELLKDSNPEEFEAAWRPEDWNWQLAYLYPQYMVSVLANPGAAKFSQTWLSDPGYLSAYKKNPREDGALRLAETERLVQGMVLFNLFTPSVGWNAINPDMEIEINSDGGLLFQGADGTNYGFLGFSENDGWSGGSATYTWATNWVESAQGSRRFGGLLPFGYTLNARGDVIAGAANAGGWNYRGSGVFGGGGRATPLDRAYSNLTDGVRRIEGTNGGKRDIKNTASNVAKAYTYDLVTVPFKIDGPKMTFIGGEMDFYFYPGRELSEATAHGEASDETVQEITVKVPGFTSLVPSVKYPVAGESDNRLRSTFAPMMGRKNGRDRLVRDSFGFLERTSISLDPANPRAITAEQKVSVALQTENSGVGHCFGRIGQVNARRSSGKAVMFGPGDIVRSVEVDHGDMRLVAASKVISAGKFFLPNVDYDNSNERFAHSLTNTMGNAYWGFRPDDERLIIPDLPQSNDNAYRRRAPLPFGSRDSVDVQLFGDFDNGVGLMIDGPYINKPDEGNVSNLLQKIGNDGGSSGLDPLWDPDVLAEADSLPYFTQPWKIENGGASYFSPNRIVSGPGMFGSLPTNVKSGDPEDNSEGAWRTLLFRPSVEGNGYTAHPGRGEEEGGQGLPDHLLMDLFWMPVVEPYAISEPLSTAGKVNMNFQMAPFLHIHRSTALRGVFRSEYMSCIPAAFHKDYKHNHGLGRKRGPQDFELMRRMMRSVIQDSKTLEQFDEYFNDGEKIFKSATEICDIHLIPQELATYFNLGAQIQVGSRPEADQISAKDMEDGTYWRYHSLVGENSKERTYANIHQRLTTKSNTFKVHFRAQVLKQSRRESDEDYKEWRPEFDSVQGEYRGSSIVERFVDPHHEELKDFASLFASKGINLNPDNGETLDQFYQYRVVNPRRFAP